MTADQKRKLAIAGTIVLLLAATGAIAKSRPGTTPTSIRAGRETMVHNTTPACRAANRYVAMVNEGRLADLPTLFADVVDYIGPDGQHRSTRAEVAAMYSGYAQATKNKSLGFELFSLTPIGKNECLMEFGISEPKTNRFVLAAIEHIFVAPDGKIDRFVPYFQSATREEFQKLISGH